MFTPFRAVQTWELPIEWQEEPDPQDVKEAAEKMGLPAENLSSSVAFCIPQMKPFTDYAAWMEALSPDIVEATVGCCMQNMYTWGEDKPGSICRILQSLDSEGHPGFEFLGRVIRAKK